MKYTIYGNNGSFELGSPLSATLKKSSAAPADQLTAAFAADVLPPDGCFFRAEENGRVWFDGVLDTVRQTLGKTKLTELSGRSRAALLLDSAALSETYFCPDFALLFRRHAEPYGFKTENVSGKRLSGCFKTESGESEWQLLDRFCRMCFGTGLTERNGVLSTEKVTAAETLRLGGSESPVLSVCSTKNIYKLCSEAWALGFDGKRHRKAQENLLTKSGLLRRKLSAAADAFETKVLCSGWIFAEPGQSVSLSLCGKTKLFTVAEVFYKLDKEGKKTRFVLSSSGRDLV